MAGISVVIPCFNAASTIIATLATVEASSMRPIEVLCVDDASTDATVTNLRRFADTADVAIRVITLGRNVGAAAARNRGAAAASGESLVFLDADVLLHSETLGRLHTAASSMAAEAAVAMYEPLSAQSGILARFQAILVHDVFDSLDANDSPYFGTQCAIVQRTTYLAANGFAESYSAATVEDLEFGARVRASGGRIVLAKDAWIRHNHAYSWPAFSRNYFRKASQLAVLARRAGGSAAGLGAGYTSPANVVSPLLVVAQLVAPVMLRPLTWRRAVVSLVPSVAAGYLWRDLLLRAERDGGVVLALQMAGLRAYVSLLGAAGAVAGVARRPPIEAASRPGADPSSDRTHRLG